MCVTVAFSCSLPRLKDMASVLMQKSNGQRVELQNGIVY